MKYLNVFILIALFSAGCSRNDEKADAYGVFESEAVILAAEVQGRVLELRAAQGMDINAGDTIALIDTTKIYLNLKQIDAQKDAVRAKRSSVQAQIAVFEEQKRNMVANSKRLQAMMADGAATQKQYDDIEGEINVVNRQIASVSTQFDQIKSELEVLEASRLAALDQMERCRVVSPVSGTVLETYIEKGELATAGKPLCKIAELDELSLRVYVSGAGLAHVKIGQEVQVMVDESETSIQSLEGKVTWISPEAEFTPKIIQTKEERVKLVYAVKVAVKNDGTLKIGMPGEVNWR